MIKEIKSELKNEIRGGLASLKKSFRDKSPTRASRQGKSDRKEVKRKSRSRSPAKGAKKPKKGKN